MQTLVFLYGTLKRGMSAHRLLAGQQFVQEARTLPRYRLYKNGAYPCLVEETSRGLVVRGEVWRVDAATLVRLDAYEDVPNTFARRPISLQDFSAPVAAYFYQGDVSSFVDLGGLWTGSA